MVFKKVTVQNETGLHMRFAGAFVNVIEAFDSDVFIVFNGNSYNAKSILSILSACVRFGDEIELRCVGSDEEKCLEEAVIAINSGLGE